MTRSVSPYRLEIRQLEERIEELRRLDAEWRKDRHEAVRKASGSLGRIGKRFRLSREHVRRIRSGVTVSYEM